jgi:hypothetical protein
VPCQRRVKPPTWTRTKDLERSNFRHKRPPAFEATLANPAAEGGTMGEKWPSEFCRKWRLPRHFWVLLHAVKHMGQTALLPLRRKACWGFCRPKNPTASAGFEPANLGTKGQHATSRPPKLLPPKITYTIHISLISAGPAYSCSPWSLTNVIQFFIISVMAQQPRGQLETEQEQKKNNKSWQKIRNITEKKR